MEATTNLPNSDFNRFEIPLKMGLLIAIIKIVISTVQYQFFLSNWIMSAVIAFLSFVIGVILLVYTGILQRKAMGGYINIKEAFQALFVAILVIVTLNYFYDLIYMKYIDPNMTEKIKEASISAAERMGAPQERLDEMEENFEVQSAAKMTVGKQLISYFSLIIWYSIVGFICAAIIKKKKPEHLA